MKIIQITDTHLMPRGINLHGLDPCKRLEACIVSINKYHSNAELCIITGDLADRGDREAYHDLRVILKQLSMPYHLLIGNHDHRKIFSEVFPEAPHDEQGFIQQVLETPVGALLMLDTVEHGEPWGSYCETRASWLKSQLELHKNKPVYLFMHHPPFAIGIPVLDRISLREDAKRIYQTVKDFSNIKHLFFGHVHRPVSGSWHGIPFTTLRGTNHQVQLDLEAEDYFPLTHEPPAYCVIFLENQQTTVHFHDFLDDSLYVKVPLSSV